MTRAVTHPRTRDRSAREGLRILIIGPAHSIALEQWVDEMLARGHEILVLSPNEPRPALADRVESTEAGFRPPLLGLLLRIIYVRRRVRSYRPDVVHGQSAIDYGLWAALSGRVPALVTCWGSDVFIAPRMKRKSRWKVRTALRCATYVTGTSQALLDAADRVAGKKLAGEIVFWGVDTDVFRPVDRSGRPNVTVLSVRGHETLYNIDVILRAFARLRDVRPHVRLVVAHQGSLTPALKDLTRELGIADAVTFLGFVEQDALPQVYAEADVYVSVPSSDASAVSNLEAMASGLPVVGSTLPSTLEWIEDGVNGLVVPPGDEDALTDALVRLVDDEGLRLRLGTEARRMAEARGSRASQMDRASEIYRLLAEGRLP